MFYFTNAAAAVIKRTFVYAETPDGKKVIIYIQDKGRAKQELNKENCKLVCDIGCLIGLQEYRVCMFGASDGKALVNKLFEIVLINKLNFIYVYIGSNLNILCFTDDEKEGNDYANSKTEESKWPVAIAKPESIGFLRAEMNKGKELSDIMDLLKKL